MVIRLIPLFLCFTLFADPIPEAPAQQTPMEISQEELCESLHTITLNGKEISYKSSVGSIVLKGDKCEPIANLFFTSYTQVSDTPQENRPVTFCFNGGPGSSSVWLHIGLAGPQRVDLPEPSVFAAPPYKMITNASSLLDLTDLVFIDPVSTGFSQAIPQENAANFYSTKQDIASIGQFIISYLTKFNRWGSPKFLMGESYGTTRASALADYLHEKEYLDFNGIVLISAVLNFQSLYPDFGNDLPYLLILPSYTATAWYHNKLGEDLQKDLYSAIAASKDFVFSTYNSSLFKGNLLSEENKQEVARRLSQLTGLSSDYLTKANLRVDLLHFTKELLSASKNVMGLYDSRVIGPSWDPIKEILCYDPSMDSVSGAFTTCFNNYLQNTLGWKKNLPYRILSDAHASWDFNAPNQFLNVSENLRDVMTKNPNLHVFVASGYYDLVTPFFATDYTFHHLGLPKPLEDHVTFGYYEGGHMMYTNPSALIQMKKDLTLFYNKALNQTHE